jgi:hypothetical protein
MFGGLLVIILFGAQFGVLSVGFTGLTFYPYTYNFL